MKRLVFLVFILLGWSYFKAQSWAPTGAQWHYRIYYPIIPYYDGVLELNATNTVVVNTITCKQIIGTYYGKTMAAWSPSTIINNYVDIKTYSNNDVYFRYDDVLNKFDTIADFNAAIGDKWKLAALPTSGTSTNNPCPSSVPIVTVTNTGTITINSTTLKKLDLAYVLFSTTYTCSMIEKIGGFNFFLFPSYHCIVDGPLYGDFICYADPSFALYKKPTITNCNYDPTLINENMTEGAISISPNPSYSFFEIDLSGNNDFEIKIIDVLGKEVLVPVNSINGKIRLDLDGKKAGIYFITFYNEGRLIATKKIIKQ